MNIEHITGQWPYTDLPSNIRVGENCFLERRDSFERFRSQRDPGLVIGDRVQIFTWTTFNLEPSGHMEIGNDSVLVGAVFMCAAQIILGRRVVVSYNVTIADSDFHPMSAELRRRDAIANSPNGDRSQRPPITSSPVYIEDDTWIGIGAIILKGVHIGPRARIGPGTVVTNDVPAGASVIGNPARPGQWEQ